MSLASVPPARIPASAFAIVGRCSRAAPADDCIPVGRGTYFRRSPANAIGRDLAGSRHRDLSREGCRLRAVQVGGCEKRFASVRKPPRGGSKGPSTRGKTDHLFNRPAADLHRCPGSRPVSNALAEYAFHAAAQVGVPLQTWVRTTWGLAVYEAKDLIRGNASEAVWERILKGRGPHCGWAIAIPILGAVIGEDLAEHFASERERIADERARYAAREAHVAALEAHARSHRSPGPAAVPYGRAAGEPRVASARMGRRTAG